MSNFNVKAIFSADTAKFMAGIGEVLAMTTQLGTMTDTQTVAMGKSFQKVGAGLTAGVTVPLIGIGVASGKAAVGFESSMAGVRKTTNLTDAEFAAMEKSIRSMSKEMPASANEIASVVEAAGQLGIEKENMTDFARVMIDLGESTNISSDEAASALARLANITGMPQTEFDRLGSTIVDLGNNFATTESEIVDMGMRLAGTGNLVGLSEAQIMALATSMTSVGINAEAGGSAFSRVMQKMNTAVVSGGAELEGFAKVSGMSAEDFAKSWKENPQDAITAFVKGLGRAQDSGDDIISTLKDLGINGIRETDTLQRLAGAGDLMSEAFDTANTAWEENTALATEAGLRYETMESQLAMAKNTLIDAGISIGQVVAPMFVSFAKAVAGVADAFANLSPGAQKAIIAFGAILAAIGPVVLIVGTFMANIVKIKSGLVALGGVMGTTSGAAGGLGAAFGAVAAPIALVVGGIALFVAALKTAWTNSESFRDTITNAIGNVQTAFGNFSGHVKKALEILSSAFTPLLGSIQGLWNKIVGALTPAFSMLGSIVGTVVAGAFNILGPVVQIVSRVFSGLMKVASGLFSALGFVAQIVGGVLAPVFSVISIAINTVVTFVSSLITAALNLANSLLDKLAPALDFVGGIAEKVGNFFGGIGDAIGGFAEKIGLVTADTNQKVTETSNLMVTSTANTASSVSLSAEQMQANASAASAMMQNNMLHNFMTTEQGATTSAQTMKTNAVDAATGMEIGMLDAAERMRTGTTKSTQTMSTDLISAVQPAAMELPQHFQIMADQAIMSMQNMGITSLEEANALVGGLGLKWEEMASWSEKDWSAVNATVTENMISAEADASAYSADILSGVGGDWTELAGITEAEFADMGVSIGTNSDSWTTDALESASELNTGMSAEWADLLSTTNTSMSEMESTITSGMNSVQNSMSTSLSGISAGFNKNFSTIISNTKSSMNTLKKTFLDTMKLSVQAFTADMNRIVDIFRRGFQKVNQYVSSDMMKILQSTQQTTRQMVTTIQHAMSASVNSFRVGMNQSLSAVNSYRGSMQSAGYNLSIGLANGISYGRSVVVNAAARVAANAVSAARNQLAIRSPSRVMETIGMYFDQGFAEGIADFAKSPVQAAGSMVKDVLSAAELRDFDFAGRIGNLNSDVSRHVDHIVKDNRSSKQPMELNFTLGQRQFRAFVEDISSVQGKDIQLEELYGF